MRLQGNDPQGKVNQWIPKEKEKLVVKGGFAKMTHDHKDMLAHTKMKVNMYIPICNILLIEIQRMTHVLKGLLEFFFQL